MWKSFEKAAKKAVRDANAAAKTVAESEQLQAVTETVTKTAEKTTRAITRNERVRKVTGRVKARTRKIVGTGDNDKKKTTKGADPKKPVSVIEADTVSVGDMSEITWTDGSMKSLPYLRVHGKDTRIVAADDPDPATATKTTLTPSGDRSRGGLSPGEHGGTTAERGLVVSGGETRQRGVAGEEEAPPPPPAVGVVKLPVLIFPGMASSGLYVVESGLDDKHKGRRLWMDAAFVVASKIDGKIVGTSSLQNRLVDHPGDPYVVVPSGPGGSPTASAAGGGNLSAAFAAGARDGGDDYGAGLIDEFDDDNGIEFGKHEDELAIRSAWLYHTALDTNMVDERPGNKVRTYEGLDACEWLTDRAIEKSAAVVWGDTVRFLEETLGYVRGTNLDAAPYE